MEEKSIKPYNYGLDIIRVIAMFLVIAVHSTTFYGFVSDGVTSFSTFISGMGRYIAFACVPLFIVLTGYLNKDKKPTKEYYFKLLRILLEYLMCGVIVALVNKFAFNVNITIGEAIYKMFNYSLPAYSWYINMFVGLYLIAPFLNYGYNSIENSKYKWIFVIVLVLVFSTTSVTSYWQASYPIMYYFIGCFIKDKQFEIKKIYLALTILIMSVVQTLLFMFPILYGVENHNNIGCIIMTCAIFLLFYKLKIEKANKPSKVLRVIANASLSTFLISVIFETMSENYFSVNNLISFSSRLPHLLYMTPIKFVLSVLIAILINVSVKYIFMFIESKTKKYIKE